MRRLRNTLRAVVRVEWIILGVFVIIGVAFFIEVVAHAAVGLLDVNDADRADAIHDARADMIQYLAGLGVAGGVVYSARTYAVNQRQQQAEHVLGAIERVGASQTAPARAAALIELCLLADERGGRYRAMADRVLVGVIRTEAAQARDEDAPPPIDVETSFEFLAKRPSDWVAATVAIDVRGAQLRRIEMPSPLHRARFDGCCLKDARLTDCDLTGATFVNACLDGADLSGATLTGARFDYASLRGVTAYHTDLEDVVLTGADTEQSPELNTLRVASEASEGPVPPPKYVMPRRCHH